MWLMIFACLNGVGQSTGWSGLVKTMANWFPSENRGVVMAWWGTNYVLGGFLATAFATWAVSASAPLSKWGWARGFVFPALLLTLIVPLFFLALSDEPPRSESSQPSHTDSSHPDAAATTWSDLRLLLKKPSLWTARRVLLLS